MKNGITSEIIAYNHLLSIGYNIEDFLLCSWNPDFVTTDGQRWEVKTIKKNGTTRFTYNQIYEYSKRETNIIGIYKNQVLFIKPYSEIKDMIINYKANFSSVFCLIEATGYWDKEKRCII